MGSANFYSIWMINCTVTQIFRRIIEMIFIKYINLAKDISITDFIKTLIFE